MTPCSATISTGAVSLTNYYATTNTGAAIGYAYAYSDAQGDAGGTSTICLTPNAFCAAGKTDVATTAHFGAGIGYNLNQSQAKSCGESTPANGVNLSSTIIGLSYSLSNLPFGGLRLVIGDYDSATGTGTDYCVALSAASGTILWTSFNSACWTTPEPAAGYLPATGPTAPTHIEFELPSSSTPEAFNFCVEGLQFATCIDTISTQAFCTSSSQCCQTGTDQPNGSVCAGAAGSAMCAASCTANTDCASGCCAELQSGASVCAPASTCCVSPGGSCTQASQCCQTGSNVPEGAVCISTDGLCHALCTSGSGCASDCCVELANGQEAACFSTTSGFTCL